MKPLAAPAKPQPSTYNGQAAAGPRNSQALPPVDGVPTSTVGARWLLLAALAAPIAAVFVVRTVIARTGDVPRLFEIFDVLIAIASALVIMRSGRILTRVDWLVGLGTGVLIGSLRTYATLFTPYPFFNVVDDLRLNALIYGVLAGVAMLGGLVVMRQGGPVSVTLVRRGSTGAGFSVAFGAMLGIPLAILNVFANSWVQGRPFTWQSPVAAALDALQPALVEEVVYRLAFLGLLWFVLRRVWPEHQAAWLAGGIALLVHTYGHYSELFVEQPLLALGMGCVMGLLWGLPPAVLALRRDVESAIGFHWIQDVARFIVGL